MKLMKFFQNENGAFQVDWVVASAAIVGFCLVLFDWLGNAP